MRLTRESNGVEMRNNVITGLGVGLIMATALSGYALVLFLFRGTEPFSKYDTTVQTLVPTYYAAGTIGGVVVGAISPLAKSLPGRMAVGVVAALILYFCGIIAARGPFWAWGSSEWELLLTLGLITGVGVSLATRHESR